MPAAQSQPQSMSAGSTCGGRGLGGMGGNGGNGQIGMQGCGCLLYTSRRRQRRVHQRKRRSVQIGVQSTLGQRGLVGQNRRVAHLAARRRDRH